MSADILPLKKGKPKTWVRASHNLVLHVPSGTYYARKFKAGKGAFFKSTEFKLKGKAQTKADEMISEWIGGRRLTRGRVRFVQVVDELYEALEQEYNNGDRRKRSFDHDGTYCPILKTLFADCFADELDEAYWDNWVRTEGRRLNRTLFDVAKYLSKALTFAHQKKYIIRKPRIKNPDRQKKVGRVYSEQEIKAILKHACPRLRLQILLGYECGMRIGEILGLTWGMIDTRKKTGAIVIILPAELVKTGSRTNEGRAFEVGANVALELREWNGSRRGFLFPSMTNPDVHERDVIANRRWRKALRAADIMGRARFHDTRHSFLSIALMDRHLPVQLVSEYAGVSIVTLQKHYLHSDAKRTASVSRAISLNFGGEEE